MKNYRFTNKNIKALKKIISAIKNKHCVTG